MNRKERQEARAERYRQYAENAEKRASSAFEASNKATEGIPFGQPILVGHHSESAHRRAVERANSAMDRSVQESEKAAYYRQKAEAVENNDNIYIGDDDAIERLEAKIKELTTLQEQMKTVNKIVRNKKMPILRKKSSLLEMGIKESRVDTLLASGTPFPSYYLTNNNAKINAAKKQLEKAKALAGKEDKEYSIGDLTIEECYSENRVRIYFPDKPDDEQRKQLKSNGFRWAPSLGCWQAYINNWTLRYIKSLNAE